MRPQSQIYIKNLKSKQLPAIMKGLRYSLGYSLCDMPKLDLGTGLVGNWECGLCIPNKKNQEILNRLIKKSKKSNKEIIEIGNLNFGNLIEDLTKKLSINEHIFLRFILSKYLHLDSINRIKNLKLNNLDLSAKTKCKLLRLKEKIEKSKIKDPRRVIFKLQKEKTLSDLDSLKIIILVNEHLKTQKDLSDIIEKKYDSSFLSELLHNRCPIPKDMMFKIENKYPNLIKKIGKKIKNKNSFIHQQWNRASKYSEIVDIYYKNEPFENEAFKLFDKICKDLIKNVLVADKKFDYITEIDLYGKYKNKKIIFLCKGSKPERLINKRNQIKKNIELIQTHIKPDAIIIATPHNYFYNTKYFEDKNTFFLDKRDFKKLKENPKIFDKLISWDIEKSKIKVNPIDKFKIDNKLSEVQLFALLDCSYHTRRILKQNKQIPNWLNKNFKYIKRTKDLRKLHFKANKILIFKDKDFLILRYIRKRLKISIKELSKKLNIGLEYIENLETGRKTSKNIKRRIKQYLKKISNDLIEKEARKHLKEKEELWKKAGKYIKIINFREEPVSGGELEEDIAKYLKKNNWIIFKNAILANKEITFKKEVDIYAIKNKKELVIECSNKRNDIKWENNALLLSEINKEFNCDVIFISPKISEFGKKVLKSRNIIGIKPKEFKDYLNEIK